MMNASSDSDPDVLELQALGAIQTADVSSLLFLLSEFRAALVQHLPQFDEHLPEVGERFLQLRKQFLHGGLEALEKTNPARAAQIQQQIDERCKTFPFDYE